MKSIKNRSCGILTAACFSYLLAVNAPKSWGQDFKSIDYPSELKNKSSHAIDHRLKIIIVNDDTVFVKDGGLKIVESLFEFKGISNIQLFRGAPAQFPYGAEYRELFVFGRSIDSYRTLTSKPQPCAVYFICPSDAPPTEKLSMPVAVILTKDEAASSNNTVWRLWADSTKCIIMESEGKGLAEIISTLRKARDKLIAATDEEPVGHKQLK